MKARFKRHILAGLALQLIGASAPLAKAHGNPLPRQPTPSSRPEKSWVTAYYGSWWIPTSQSDEGLTPDRIDYSLMTHLIYHGLTTHQDGTVDSANIGTRGERELIRRGHAKGVKVLIDVNGREGIRDAVSPGHLSAYLRNISKVVVQENFDGVDVDWEPLLKEDTALYRNFIHRLRRTLNALSTQTKKPYLLTAAVADEPALFAELQSEFDQINVMAYDLGGTWIGETWHNGALFSPPTMVQPAVVQMAGPDDVPFPSAASMLDAFVQAGVEKSRLGLGVDAYGYLWRASSSSPLNGPRQKFQGLPEINDNIPLAEVMTEYYSPQRYRWDPEAHAPYLSETTKGREYFLSYDDERSCRDKVSYVRVHGFGGVMLWELGGDWLPRQAVEEPLARALHDAASAP